MDNESGGQAMATSPERGAVVSAIRELWGAGNLAVRCDADLLSRFARDRDEAAFGALVRRHAVLVFGVCRRVLRDEHAAEDASQVTFLILARKAESIAAPERLGAWLHGVALRTSKKVKSQMERRREKERVGGAVTNHTWVPDQSDDDIRLIIDEELAHLPEKYRSPVLLCDLEGRSIDDAASVLGCPRGTVGTRLAKARTMLKTRLTRRGLGLGTGLAVCHGATNPVSAVWINQTTHIATLFATLTTARAETAVPTVVLARQILWGMTMMRLRICAALVVATIFGGIGFITLRGKPVAAQARADDSKPKGASIAAPADQDAAARTEASRKLKTIALAMHYYHSKHNHLPPAAIRSPRGKPLLSWRVAILPFLDEQALYNKFKLDEPWDSPHNKALLVKMPKVYAPRAPTKVPNTTHYQVFVGPDTPLGLATADVPRAVSPPQVHAQLDTITDATSATILAIQGAERVPWTKPEDISFARDNPSLKGTGPLKGGFLAVMADGSIRFISQKAKDKTVEMAIMRADGGEFDLEDLDPK